jgi:hypothetical protein
VSLSHVDCQRRSWTSGTAQTSSIGDVTPADSKRIEPSSTRLKKSSTFGICSCFGRKSAKVNGKPSADKTRQPSLSDVNMTRPLSVQRSTLESAGVLRAPIVDLPPMDLTPKATEMIRLPTKGTKRSKPTATTNNTDMNNVTSPCRKQDATVVVPIVEAQIETQTGVQSSSDLTLSNEHVQVRRETMQRETFDKQTIGERVQTSMDAVAVDVNNVS